MDASLYEFQYEVGQDEVNQLHQMAYTSGGTLSYDPENNVYYLDEAPGVPEDHTTAGTIFVLRNLMLKNCMMHLQYQL